MRTILLAIAAVLTWVSSAAGADLRKVAATARTVAQPPAPLAAPMTNPESEIPNWGWHAVTASPRIGLDMRAIDVDPTDPNRIFIGTEEGTILRSFDGGITWAETDLHPFILRRAPLPPEPARGEARDPTEQMTPALIAWNMLPFNLWPPSGVLKPKQLRISSLFRGDLWIFGWGTRQSETLLREVTEGIVKPQSPVHRVVSCPGSEYALIAAAEHDLFGSSDGGETFVRLFGLPHDKDPITMVACSLEHPGEIVASSSRAVYVSRDGGVTFDQLLYGIPGTGSSFVAFAAAGRGDTIYSAEGSTLWVIDTSDPSKAKRSYPFTASPFSQVRWVATSTSGAIWLATDRGIRLSNDGGKTWISVAPDQFESFDWWDVTLGANDTGGERVVIEREHFAYASDDGGRTWYLWFSGGTKRELRHVAASVPSKPGDPSRWWLLTREELWSTQVARGAAQATDVTRAAPRWAARRLEHLPPLGVLLEAANDSAALDEASVSDVVRRMRTRSWLPRVDLTFTSEWQPGAAASQAFIATRSDQFLSNLSSGWVAKINATFFLPDIPYPTYGSPPATQKTLYILRQRMNYALEDAYWERVLRLRQIAGGGLDDLQTLVVRSRVDALDAMIAALTQESREPRSARDGR
jgi:photosystem II stability/assembly factor-like uncharacterized protein